MKPIRISTIGKIVWLFIFCTILVIIALIVSSLKKEENNLPVKPVSGDEKKVIDYTSSKSSEIDFSKYNSEETIIELNESKTYTITGENSKYSFVVNAPNKVVKINLKDFSTNQVDDLFDFQAANKIMIELTNENKIEFIPSSDDLEYKNTNIINSKVDIDIMGKGTLSVNTNNNFISSDANISIKDATINIIKTNHAFKGKNIEISSGLIYLKSNSIGIESNGNFYIQDGKTILISENEESFKANGIFLLNGGEVFFASLKEQQKPNANSTAKTAIFNFSESTNKILTLQDTEKIVFIYDGITPYQHILYSNSTLKNKDYVLYGGGRTVGQAKYSFYDPTDYFEDIQYTCEEWENDNFQSDKQLNVFDDIVKK